jgi:hypothetical protein
MEGNNWLIVCLLSVEDCDLDDDDPGPIGAVGQGTRWESSHACDIKAWVRLMLVPPC